MKGPCPITGEGSTICVTACTLNMKVIRIREEKLNYLGRWELKLVHLESKCKTLASSLGCLCSGKNNLLYSQDQEFLGMDILYFLFYIYASEIPLTENTLLYNMQYPRCTFVIDYTQCNVCNYKHTSRVFRHLGLLCFPYFDSIF